MATLDFPALFQDQNTTFRVRLVISLSPSFSLEDMCPIWTVSLVWISRVVVFLEK